jgi:2-polyprenyl-6-methoxyphenol hydroxylase-like FAD-dependent oxidoreductase
MKTILISGAGIAGPTLGFWLKTAGFEPTLIERAPALHADGYVIDFWGLGCIAERMGLIADVNRVGYKVRELRIVNDRGRRVAGFGTNLFTELTGGRYVTLPRSELSRLLFEKVKDTAEVIFDEEIVGLEDLAHWSKHSRRIDPINRSAKPFCQGEAGAIGLSRMPMARSRRVTTVP